MRDALPGLGFVLLLRLAENRELRVPAVDQVGVRLRLSEIFVAPLQERIFNGDLGQRIGMRM